MIRFAFGAFVSLLVVFAQQTTFCGQVIAERNIAFDQLTIEIAEPHGSGLLERAPVQTDGRFRVPGLPPGVYRVRVLTLHGDVLQEESVTAPVAGLVYQIRLPAPRGESAGGPVSWRRLRHRPPKAVQKLWRQAVAAADRGDHGAARAALELAVAQDPDYFEALVNLGVERYRQGDAAGALAAFEAALRIDPDSPQALSNRALALLRLGRYAEAEQAARRALQLEESATSHYLVGLSLANQGQNWEEARSHLQAAEARHPEARAARLALERQRAARPAAPTSKP